MVAAAKVTPILAAVSTKNGSGTMFINKSVDGSRIHRSLVKNILWKSIKYFVKSVDIMAARAAVNAKNSAYRYRASEAAGVLYQLSSAKAVRC